MKYIVMECHYSYAIVLDEDCQFTKCANLNYQVGQKLDHIVPMQSFEDAPVVSVPEKQPGLFDRLNRRLLAPAFTTAFACLLIAILLLVRPTTFASVYLTINPEVRIDINKKEHVLRLEGTNSDGKELIRQYTYANKTLNQVTNELLDLAIQQDYLSDGGHIRIDIDSTDDQWRALTRDVLRQSVEKHLLDKVTFTIEFGDRMTPTDKSSSPGETFIIPIDPKQSDDDSSYDESDYDERPSTSTKPVAPVKPPATDDDSGYDDSKFDDSGYEESNDDRNAGQTGQKTTSQNNSVGDDSEYDDSEYDDSEVDDSEYDDSPYDD